MTDRKGRQDTQSRLPFFYAHNSAFFCPQSHEKHMDDKIHTKTEKTRQKRKEWAKTA